MRTHRPLCWTLLIAKISIYQRHITVMWCCTYLIQHSVNCAVQIYMYEVEELFPWWCSHQWVHHFSWKVSKVWNSTPTLFHSSIFKMFQRSINQSSKSATIRREIILYRKTSSISHIKSKNLNVSHPVLQLSVPNPLKPGVKSRMKM